MISGIISVRKCKTGDIVASDIITRNGVYLVGKNTIMNQYIKEHLLKMGVQEIHIYRLDDAEHEHISYENLDRSYREMIYRVKEVIQDLAAGRPLDFKKIDYLSEQIRRNMNDYSIAVKYLHDIKSSDNYTYTHSINTAFYSMLIGKWMELSDSQIKEIIISGLLHDVGKTKVPSEILNKPGKYTNEEFDIMKKHSIFGYEILRDCKEVNDEIRKAVLLHHERIDGSGYPFHYYEKDLNLYARIVALADVFDAMTSDRVYKKSTTPFNAFEMFQTEGLRLFDIKMINLFLKNYSTYLIGSHVYLSDGQMGEIVYIPLYNITEPIVKVRSGFMDMAEKKVDILKVI